MFKIKPCITGQIEEYALWKYERHPYIAGAEKILLERFTKAANIKDVNEINREVVAYFIASRDSEYESKRVLVALRGFLRYARWAGYPCIHYIHLTERNLMALKKGPKIDYARVAKIKEMRNRGVPFRKIVEELGKTSKKRVHLSGVVRWARLVVPT